MGTPKAEVPRNATMCDPRSRSMAESRQRLSGIPGARAILGIHAGPAQRDP